jgi:hypothetical protein
VQEKLPSAWTVQDACPCGETVFDETAFTGGGTAAAAAIIGGGGGAATAGAEAAFGATTTGIFLLATKPPGAESAFLMDTIANKAEKKSAVVFIFVLV